MNSTKKEMCCTLLNEEKMMNGNNNNNNNSNSNSDNKDKVHPDLLKIQQVKVIVTTNGLSWMSRFTTHSFGVCFYFTIAAYILVCVDAIVRLGLPTFGVLLFVLPIFVYNSNALALKPNNVPPTLDGERVFGEIIHSFWVLPGEQAKVELCYFIVQYTFDGVTYQRKYWDNTWGLFATEKYLELIVNKANPKEPLSTLRADYLYRHCHNTGTITGLLKEAFSWLTTLLLFSFVALPLLAIPYECNRLDKHCTPSVWMDATLHYIFTLALILLPNHAPKVKTPAIPPCSIAMDRVEKPFVPEAEDRVVDHALFLSPPSSSHTSWHLTNHYVSLMLCMIYITVNSDMIDLSYIVILLIYPGTLLVITTGVTSMIKNVYMKSLHAKYCNEGVPPKNMTVLKSSDHTLSLISIIQYEVDVTNKDGYFKTVTAQARIQKGNEEKILILPSDPTTAFVPEEVPQDWKAQILDILLLLNAFVVLFSSSTWKDSTTLFQKCIFVLISSTLVIISSVCCTMYFISLVHIPALGKRGNTVVRVQH